MSFCTQCGSPATAAQAFCTQCGAQVLPVAPPSVADPAPDASAGVLGSAPVSAQSIAARMPQWGQVSRRGWWLLGGATLVFIGSLLPWSQQSVDGYTAASSHPGGGGVIVFLVLALAAIASGWPLLAGGLSKRRLVGASVAAALLALFAITNWSSLHHVQQQAAGLGGGFATVNVAPGSGLLIYTVGVVLLCALMVRLWLPGRRSAHAVV